VQEKTCCKYNRPTTTTTTTQVHLTRPTPAYITIYFDKFLPKSISPRKTQNFPLFVTLCTVWYVISYNAQNEMHKQYARYAFQDLFLFYNEKKFNPNYNNSLNKTMDHHFISIVFRNKLLPNFVSSGRHQIIPTEFNQNQ